ncbi:MAG TPA: hypothetical protein VJH22_03500 [Candidatus Nanoarchaeia archaeon]|nr:hypothetical protein [Candidatus Nanoarchaeia archaeon]
MRLAAILIVCLFLFACGSSKSPSAAQQTVEENAPLEQAPEDVITEPVDIVAEESNSPLDMMSGIASGVSMKCVVEEDGQTATVYAQGKQMRMDTMPANSHAIYNDEELWAWTGAQGMHMKMSDIQKVSQMTGQAVESRDEVVERQNTNADCVEEEAPAGSFTPPSDVEFQDFAALMAQFQGQIPQQ